MPINNKQHLHFFLTTKETTALVFYWLRNSQGTFQLDKIMPKQKLGLITGLLLSPVLPWQRVKNCKCYD